MITTSSMLWRWVTKRKGVSILLLLYAILPVASRISSSIFSNLRLFPRGGSDANRRQQTIKERKMNRDGGVGSRKIDKSNNSDAATIDTEEKLFRRKLQFLDRIAVISSQLLKRESSSKIGNNNSLANNGDGDYHALAASSDLMQPNRYVHIVTTAALPWFTGTAVNPLLRAAYLHRKLHALNLEATSQNYANSSNVNTTTSSFMNDENVENSELHQSRNINQARSGTNAPIQAHGSSTERQSLSSNDSATTTTTITEFDNDSTHATSAAAWVTLVVPWLELPEDQVELYGRVFENMEAQEAYMRNWLATDADMPEEAKSLAIVFYPARYHSGLRSIFAMGDIVQILLDKEQHLDVCVLEEPEHLNWYRAPNENSWTKQFQHVIGIVHTNYKEYASSHYSGLWTAPAIAMMSSAMVRAYCHKVIKLSAVLQTYAPEKEEVSNVHGVRSDFLQEGLRRREEILREQELRDDGPVSPKVYYIGKLLWAKGLDIMLELEDYYKQCTGDYFEIDIFGSGPDQNHIMRAFHSRWKLNDEENENENPDLDSAEVQTSVSIDGDFTHLSEDEFDVSSDDEDLMEEGSSSSSSSRESLKTRAKRKFRKFKKKLTSYDLSKVNTKLKKTITSYELPKSFSELRRSPIPANFPGRVDHAIVKDHQVFVNPSLSEVLCTTTAEALAMGKFVIIPAHPSNTFFLQFPNCLAYRNKFEFVANLRWALTHYPEPLTPELSRQFTWEAATDRLIEASQLTNAEVSERERRGLSKLDDRIAWFHNEIGKGATGDMLRKILGAGPASDQVKYVTARAVKESGVIEEEVGSNDDDDDDDSKEDEDDGLSRKFRRSSFAEAIRATIGDLSLFMQ